MRRTGCSLENHAQSCLDLFLLHAPRACADESHPPGILFRASFENALSHRPTRVAAKRVRRAAHQSGRASGYRARARRRAARAPARLSSRRPLGG